MTTDAKDYNTLLSEGMENLEIGKLKKQNAKYRDALEMVNRTIKNGDLILVGSSYHKWIEEALTNSEK